MKTHFIIKRVSLSPPVGFPQVFLLVVTLIASSSLSSCTVRFEEVPKGERISSQGEEWDCVQYTTLLNLSAIHSYDYLNKTFFKEAKYKGLKKPCAEVYKFQKTRVPNPSVKTH